MLFPQISVQIRALREDVSVNARMRLDHTAGARCVRNAVYQDQAAEVPAVREQIQRNAFVGTDLTYRDFILKQRPGRARAAVVDVDLILDSRDDCGKLLVGDFEQIALSDLQRFPVQPKDLSGKTGIDKETGRSR